MPFYEESYEKACLEIAEFKKHRDHWRKAYNQTAKYVVEARDGKIALKDRVQKGMRKALHPDWADTDDEDNEEGDEEDEEEESTSHSSGQPAPLPD